MSPEMLMQPFEQSFSIVPMFNNYYQSSTDNHATTDTEQNNNNYFFDFTQHPDMDPNGHFRTTFYNPFEIKHRRRTSRAQLKVLEKSFSENPKPNATVRRILAQQLDMTPRGVQIWFQNLATAAAVNCMLDNTLPDDVLINQNDWFKMPIHPLAPVIDNTESFGLSSEMSSDEWRRKSCPILGTKNTMYPSPWPLSNNNHLLYDRRLIPDDLSTSRLITRSLSEDYPISKWNTSTSSSLDLYYSPMSQQLTPMLSTGSPVSSIDGGYYDSCFDLLMTSSSM
ncbi:uncharacterized protein BX663DRAFT_546988 [Cokeromyces recurvatus]|uniref:uncharacterized protein n=1 Tax=Cokeromyces recurvatus TaxID=90255 RepID=UPI00221FA737|nr:uncharacterized protein BX663DRAFT_546988 [Cokeromyces recurvatus]KAI7897646.1 hypothetical protein BX663DRAFT_546988 [Cokeromyces recurvatus]